MIDPGNEIFDDRLPSVELGEGDDPDNENELEDPDIIAEIENGQ